MTLTAEGAYLYYARDKAGNETEYGFEIVYAVNAAGTIVIIIVAGLTVGGIVSVWLMRKRKAFKKKPRK